VKLPNGSGNGDAGDNVSAEISLITPVALEKGLRFADPRSGHTVGAGAVTEISSKLCSRRKNSHSFESVRSPNSRPVHARDRRDRQRTGATVAGPIPLPTRSTLDGPRSPHVDKKSREQFEMRTHKRLIDILEPTPDTVDALMKLDLPPGVDVEIKAFGGSTRGSKVYMRAPFYDERPGQIGRGARRNNRNKRRDGQLSWLSTEFSESAGHGAGLHRRRSGVGCTVLQAGPLRVVQRRTKEKGRLRRCNWAGGIYQAQRRHETHVGHFKKSDAAPMRRLREVRLDDSADETKAGDRVLVDRFKPGELVNVTASARARVCRAVKRWHFRGGDATHGSMHHRAPGGIGGIRSVAVWARAAFSGAHGQFRVTAKNLRVVKVVRTKFAVGVRIGAGPVGTYILIRKARKSK